MTKAKWINIGAATAMIAATMGVATPAMARGYERGDYYRDGYSRDYRGYGSYRDYRDYRDVRRGDYYRGDRYYGGDRGRYHDARRYRCQGDGTAGTVIGAIAGGLLGNSVAGRHGDRTAGTIIGGAVGAIAGRAIDKGDDRC